MSFRDTLLAEVNGFLADTGFPVTRLGREAVNDPHFVKRMREGCGITLASADKVRAFIQEQRQAEAAKAIPQHADAA